jgi:hypothetical protein
LFWAGDVAEGELEEGATASWANAWVLVDNARRRKLRRPGSHLILSDCFVSSLELIFIPQI